MTCRSMGWLVLLAYAGWCVSPCFAEEPAAKPKLDQAAPSQAAPSQAALEKTFGEKLSGCVFVGNFTLGRVTPETKLSEDRYEIRKVSKLKDDLWLFDVRIKYGEHDVTLPLPLRVLWAGDTPVITLDKLPVPGLGTFTARVLIYEDEYAGTWGGADHGGHLFGRIERATPEK